MRPPFVLHTLELLLGTLLINKNQSWMIDDLGRRPHRPGSPHFYVPLESCFHFVANYSIYNVRCSTLHSIFIRKDDDITAGCVLPSSCHCRPRHRREESSGPSDSSSHSVSCPECRFLAWLWQYLRWQNFPRKFYFLSFVRWRILKAFCDSARLLYAVSMRGCKGHECWWLHLGISNLSGWQRLRAVTK